MKLTNKMNLPAPLVAAIANDKYDGGGSDYSTTGLLRPPRIAQLGRQYRDELVEDASDRLWSLYGQIVHGIIERAATDEIVEKRLFMTIGGKIVSGQIDLSHNRILCDWKFVTRYATKDGIKEEWVQQGQINRLLCYENGIDIEAIEYTALYRDYSTMAAGRDSEYPQSAVETFKIPLWPLEKTRAFVEERIRLHEAAKIELPLCSNEERWMKPEKWALMKKGQKRAVKLYETEHQAQTALENMSEADQKFKGRLEHRPGEQTRCLFYCPVSARCSQFRELVHE